MFGMKIRSCMLVLSDHSKSEISHNPGGLAAMGDPQYSVGGLNKNLQ